MKQQIICPKCFARYPSEQRMLVCQNQSCPDSGTSIRESASVLIDGQPHCPRCSLELTVRLCPRCNFEFSGHNAGAEMLGISVVGAERCGKSHYLSVLVNSLRKEMSKAYGCALYPLGGDNTIEQYNRHYFHPLFVQGRCVSSTQQEDVEPLIYSLVFPDSNTRSKNSGKTANLTFYDACGANFNSVRTLEQSNRNIYNSRGILFLIDPTQFITVRERRRAAGKTVNDVDPVTIISRIIHLIRAGAGQSDVRKKITIPIAVCLTKMDIVRPWLDPASFIRCRSRHLNQPSFDSIDFESCSLEVISLIESWQGKELVNQVKSQFANYGFFAFSSLGQEPTSDGTIQHIQPHRVMDPLLWILNKNKIIAGRNA